MFGSVDSIEEKIANKAKFKKYKVIFRVKGHGREREKTKYK